MTNKNIHINCDTKWDFTIYKKIRATRQKIFNAWMLSGNVKEWWGPHHFINPFVEWDLRVGGRFHIDMTAPDGAVFPMRGIFHEIDMDSKLVFTTTAFEDENGNSPLEYVNTVSFREDNDQTLILFKAKIMKSVAGIECLTDGIKEGWKQSLDKLELFIQNKNQF
jgi:uncharacterized protein YndB with AHSA1/START domain